MWKNHFVRDCLCNYLLNLFKLILNLLYNNFTLNLMGNSNLIVFSQIQFFLLFFFASLYSIDG